MKACLQQMDLKLSGPPPGQGACGGARTRNRAVRYPLCHQRHHKDSMQYHHHHHRTSLYQTNTNNKQDKNRVNYVTIRLTKELYTRKNLNHYIEIRYSTPSLSVQRKL
ncbi:hypothetical protein PoB_005294300 [Plakobranchus ocellatus]|uniref:Uncharacterized protein n=1 Tax=Plakobranchus ocellatus TaxID=259542 RepID=A0AAV4C3E4_9GAST|nr:hypothetical protein PoB_005294300 [Plakobranchus ocellatus]